MRRLPDGFFRFSPRDLIAFLEGDFAAWCERNRAERSRLSGLGAIASRELTQDVPDEEMALVIRRGVEHEAAHLEQLRSREPRLIEINSGHDAQVATLRAMRAGAPIIDYPG